jgi:hypothetical protein
VSQIGAADMYSDMYNDAANEAQQALEQEYQDELSQAQESFDDVDLDSIESVEDA